MNKWMAILMICLVINNASAEDDRVRRLALQSDQIAQVKTSLGIATIIQVPDVPNSVVVGDTEAFKVEYLDQAITVKPLHSGAKSNLYIYTDYRRYNVQLVSAGQTEANYIVYLEPTKSVKKNENPIKIITPRLSGIRWWKLNRNFTNGEIQFEVKKVGLSSNEIVLFEFLISSQKTTEINPAAISLKQNGSLVPIHNLFLSNLTIDSKNAVKGTIEVLKSDLKLNSAIRFDLKRKITTVLTIPEVSSWVKLKQSL